MSERLEEVIKFLADQAPSCCFDSQKEIDFCNELIKALQQRKRGLKKNEI